LRTPAWFLVLATLVPAQNPAPDTPTPSATVPKKTRTKKTTPKRLSREFRKNALLAKVAWDQLLQSVSRSDDESPRHKYEDEAEKADALVRAEEQTTGDMETRHCLLRYENKVLSYSLAVENTRLSDRLSKTRRDDHPVDRVDENESEAYGDAIRPWPNR
jgi:hypothetical protein